MGECKQQHKTVDGVTVKPDIVVELANGGNLVIDSKFPYDDFRRAVEEKDASKQEEHYKTHKAAIQQQAEMDLNWWDSRVHYRLDGRLDSEPRCHE